jgi:hypothetical protein
MILGARPTSTPGPKRDQLVVVVTSTLKPDTEHSQLLGIVNCTDYGTHQRISYEVQATNESTNVQKVVREVPKY